VCTRTDVLGVQTCLRMHAASEKLVFHVGCDNCVAVYCVVFQESYSTQGQKRAYPPSDAMNAALAAFYGDEQGAAKRSRLN